MLGRKLLVVCVGVFAALGLQPSHTYAQTAVNPTQAIFDQSPDHNATNTSGAPIVASYQLRLYLVGASAPFQSIDLGKPTPVAGVITVDLRTQFIGWPVPGTNYFSDVVAVGPSGTSAAAQSNQFSFTSNGCTYTVSPTSLNPPSAGASQNITVTASASVCPWAATSNASWITVTSGASGTGSGTVAMTVAANTVTLPRTGTLTIAGQTFTVNQSAAPCVNTLSPTSQSIAAAGSLATVAVNTTTGCNWTATSNASWITVTSGATGSGAGSVDYSVAANTVTSPRTGTLTIAGQTLTVNQSAAACVFSIAPTSQSLAAAGGTGSTAVTTGTGCNWTATSNASWITITSGATGTGDGSTGYSVAANTVTTPRSGTVTVAGQTLTINQSAAACSYSLTPTSQNMAASAGTGSTAVGTTTGCTWTATSNASWITITSGASGSGGGNVGYSVAANTVTSPRTGTLTVAGQTFTVNQTAAACSYSISPTSQSFAAAGSAATAAVNTTTGCNWTATSNASWITINAGSSGSGGGNVDYTVAANTVTTPRTGTLTIAGQTLTVNQGAAPCVFSIAPTSQTLAAAGGTGSSAVTTTTGCNWTATSNASWITITSGASGSGSGTTAYSVAANTVTTPRSGTVTIAGQTLTINQSAAACSYLLTPTSQSIVAAGSTGSTTSVNTTAGCAWTAVSNVSWITITSGSSGSGAGTVTYNVAANALTGTRTGTVTIGTQTLTVNQSGLPCNYSISPTSQSIASAGGPATAAVTTTTGCNWTAASNASWITVTNGASGADTGNVDYSVAANTVTTPRSGTLTIAGQMLTVNQGAAPCVFTIAPTSQTLAASASTGSTAVTTTTGCSWTATSNASWITITSGASGSGSGTTAYSVAANTVTTPRSGTLTVAGQTLTINQGAAACNYSLTPTSQSIAATGSTGSTTAVNTTTGCAWTAVSNDGWITVTGGSSGTGGGTVTYNVAANTVTSARTGTVTIAGQTLTVNQSAAACNYGIVPTSQSIASAGGPATASVNTTAGCTWTATSNASWLTITGGASGSDTGTVDYTVAANTVTSPRTGTLSIAGQTLTVNQAAAPCIYSISPTSQTLAATAGTGSTAVTTTTGCSWTATSNASWITITSGSSGSGGGTVAYSVAANSVTVPRTGTVTVAGQTLTINQIAAACNYSLTPTSQSISAAGSTGSTTSVNTTAGCAWTAVSNSSWITLTAGSSGTGGGTVTYNVAANTITSARTGTVTIAGQILTVNQTAAPCNYALSSASQSMAAAGSAGTVDVNTTSGCNWSATSNASWITITSGASGTDSGTVGYLVAANTVGTPRTGTLTIASQTFTVNQSAAACVFSLSPASQSIPASGSASSSTAVTATSGCAWTASSNASWITVTGGATGTGNGSVTYSVAVNTITTPRSGTLTVAGQTLTVNQSAAACGYSISPTSFSPAAAATSSSTAVTTTTGCAWTATSNSSWITVSGGASGTGSGAVFFDVAANTSISPRSGSLNVAGQTFSVTQAGIVCSYGASPTPQTMAAAGGSSTAAVTTSSECAWTATSNAGWITITSGSNGTGSGSVAFTVAANTVTSARTGTLTVAGQTISVNQDAACSYSISPTSQSVTSTGSTGSTTAVTAGGGCNWTATSNTSWITLTGGSSGAGNGTVTYDVAANTGTSARTGTLTVAGQTLTVNQSTVACSYSLTPTSQSTPSAGSTGSTTTVNTTSGCAWTATSNVSWVTITSGSSGTGTGAVTFDVALNTSAGLRTGTITAAGKMFVVTQAGLVCNYSATPTPQSMASAGGASTVSVATNTGCAWTATSNASWITLTSGSNGSGNGTVGFSVSANTGTSLRTGTLTVAGQTVTVNQTSACNYSISPSSQSVVAAGSSGSTAVTVATGCNWTAASNAAWITVTAGSSGAGNGTVTYDVAANPTSSARTGTLTVAGQTLTVSQSAVTCSYSISPTSYAAAAAGASSSTGVTTATGCSWTATSNASWIVITSGSSGTGNGTVAVDIAANTGTSLRTGTVSVAGKTFVVTQGGLVCNYTATPTPQTIAAAGGTSTVSVTTNNGCAWTAESNAGWITLTSGTNGTGNGTVAFTVDPNASAGARTGTLTAAGRTITINQAALVCSSSFSPTSQSVAASGATASPITVSATTGCAWTASSDVNWIVVTSGATGTGNGTVTYDVAANPTTSARTGTMTVAEQTFTVNQAASACGYNLSPTSLAVAAAANSASTSVTTTGACSWTATSNSSWITITSGSAGAGSGAVAFDIAENTAATQRTGSMTIAGQAFSVTQYGVCSYLVSPAAQNVSATGMSATASVTTASGCAWTAESNAGWITVTNGSGVGGGTAAYSVDPNLATSPRSGTLTVAGQTITVNQSAAGCNYTLSPTSATSPVAGGPGTVDVTTSAGCSWTASVNSAWITLTSGSGGTGSGTLGYSVRSNTSGNRTGTLTIAGQTFTIQQSGNCSYTLSSTTQTVAEAGATKTTTVSTTAGCAWTAVSNVSWITVTGGSSGTNNGIVTYVIASNTGAPPRVGTLTIAGQTVTVNEAGVLVMPSAPSGIRFTAQSQ